MCIRLLGLFSLVAATGVFADDRLSLAYGDASGGVRLVASGQATSIYVDQGDSKVVHLAATCLAGDVERVTGIRPKVIEGAPVGSDCAVFVGTVGRSPLIDSLIQRRRLDVTGIHGRWESYVVTVVADPVPGVKTGLVIAGSDRRGTAYGVFEVSETIGVSPWVWWADVAPVKRGSLVLGGTRIQGPPGVKYRGIFINDEDWGFHPWAAQTFEPEAHDSGPKTYARVCELLLRLRANFLWPAMHPCTRAFNLVPGNKEVTDDYAIVMGSSHHEPMLRNTSEYDRTILGPYNYWSNRDRIRQFWEEFVTKFARTENIYTVGMRGLGDSAMEAPKDTTNEQKKDMLQDEIIPDQREILARHVNANPALVPQVYVPYKEALLQYQAGLKLPDDITLVWPDDNFGYIRELSNATEQRRSGGGGVYYHNSYWGAPQDYLWLNTTPPALMWEEMSKAYDNGARTVWLVNVGDIKPMEIGMEFFLRMASNPEAWDENAQDTFLKQWAARDFGAENAAEITAIMDEYYQLNFQSKPEHLDRAHFTYNYHEIPLRQQRFAKLVERTDALYAKLPPEKRDSFFEMVAYPVRGSALANEKTLAPSLDLAQRAYDQLQTETKTYNEEIAGGKWRNMMSSQPRKAPALLKPAASAIIPAPGPGGLPVDETSVSIEAEHPTRATPGGTGATWKVIKGLGRTGDSIALLPTSAAVPGSATLEYDFTAARTGTAKVLVYAIPTHALHPDMKLRYAASIDGELPKECDLDTREYSQAWSENVLGNTAIGTTEHTIPLMGKHTLRLHPLDPGVVFDKIVIDFGDLKPSQLGPPESPPVQ